jgi:hypothetical protein
VCLTLLIPAVVAARQAAMRVACKSNLSQVGMAVLAFECQNGRFPAAITTTIRWPSDVEVDWVLDILPFIGEDNLCYSYRRDKEFTDSANRDLCSAGLTMFRCPGGDKAFQGGIAPEQRVDYYALVSKSQRGRSFVYTNIMQAERGLLADAVTDGLSNTLLIAEGDRGYRWCNPRFAAQSADAVFDSRGTSNVHHTRSSLWGDGHVTSMEPGVKLKLLQALVTAQGGEVVEAP